MTRQENLHSLAYWSATTRSIEDGEIDQLLESARKFNRIGSITGILLFSGENFLQILEGPQDQIDLAMERIRNDERHERIKVLFEGPLDARSFSDWSMGFQTLENGGIRASREYLELKALQNPTGRDGFARGLIDVFELTMI